MNQRLVLGVKLEHGTISAVDKKLIGVVENHCLILTQATPEDWAFKAWIDNGVKTKIIYKDVILPLRVVRRLWVELKLPFQGIWYGDWKEDVENARLVIINMTSLTLDLPIFINRINPNCRVIAWYWNAVSKENTPEKVRGDAELWSFDPNDCEKYGMKFNHQFYFESLVKNSSQLVYDIYFCGTDAGRGEQLIELYKRFKSMGMRAKFSIVQARFAGIPEHMKSNYVPYDSICDEVARARSLLEIVRDGQSGPTLRQMEALFFKKKLITNNRSVVNERYYTEQNVFVLGKRDLRELPEFVRSPIDEEAYAMRDEFEFASWLRAFNDLVTVD